jgi:uncharacterized membrane protein YgcG
VKRFLTILLAAALGFAASAQQIRDIDITVELQEDGSAWITQRWDVQAPSSTGWTEWYVPIGNLGDMTVSDLSVSENGQPFESVGDRWDVDWSRSRKAGKCGIVRKRDGVELCWGLGEYGDHRWSARFKLNGLVQALDDADAFNFMFVNPGLAAEPQHVRVVISPAFECPQWTTDNTKVWGFGYYGDINVRGGNVVAESAEAFEYRSKLIALVRFDKGIFRPAVVRGGAFDDMLQAALDGSSYGADDDFPWYIALLSALAVLLPIIFLIYAGIASALGYKYKKSLFGKQKITEWYRDIPVEGDLFAAFYALEYGKRFAVQPSAKNLIGALFLRWILDKHITVVADPKSTKRVNLSFADDTSFPNDVEDTLYRYARAASGDNLILEKNEFERWSRKNYAKMTAWPDRAKARGKNWFHVKHYFVRGTQTTEEGAREACHVIEFKNFLKDFTLSKQREAVEVGLWKDYLVFAQLYGIADKVAEQFKKLYPAEFQEVVQNTGLDTYTMLYVINHTNAISTSALQSAYAKAGSVSGGGGHSSFGGGGGFSGGGFGGGGR